MAATPDDLLRIARRCAEKLDTWKRRALPSLEDLEEQCEAGIEDLLSVLQAADAFGELDLAEQQRLLDQLEAALPEPQRELVDELIDLHTQEVWLRQEAAYYLGMAVGMRVAREDPDAGAPDADEAPEDGETDGDLDEE
jgi:hypothetical protein